MFFSPFAPTYHLSPTFTPTLTISQVPPPRPTPSQTFLTSRNPPRHWSGVEETPKPGRKARADKKEAREGEDPGARETKGKEKRLLTVGSHPWKHEAGRRVLI